MALLTLVFVKARLILSFMVVKQLSFTDFIRKLWKSGTENFVLFFVFQALLITFNKSSNVCAAVLFPNFQLLEIKNGSRWHHFAGPKWKTTLFF